MESNSKILIALVALGAVVLVFGQEGTQYGDMISRVTGSIQAFLGTQTGKYVMVFAAGAAVGYMMKGQRES